MARAVMKCRGAKNPAKAARLPAESSGDVCDSSSRRST
jgi:hypothetical protein